MYSYELQNLIHDGYMSREDYRYFNVNESPQIIHIKYDAFNDSFYVKANDGYEWSFKVKGDD